MANIILDVASLTVHPAEENQSLQEWLERVQEWIIKIDKSNDPFYYSSNSEAQLYGTSLLLNPGRINKLRQNSSLDIDLDFIYRKIKNLLARSVDLEKELLGQFKEVNKTESFEPKDIILKPALLEKRWPEDIRPLQKKLLGLAAACQAAQKPFLDCFQLATLPLETGTESVIVEADIYQPPFPLKYHRSSKIRQTIPFYKGENPQEEKALAQWPDLHQCMETFLRLDPTFLSNVKPSKPPLQFSFNSDFLAALKRYARDDHLKKAVIKAIAKKIYHKIDKGLGDEQVMAEDFRRFRVNDFWRIHYYHPEGKKEIILEELVPHNKGL